MNFNRPEVQARAMDASLKTRRREAQKRLSEVVAVIGEARWRGMSFQRTAARLNETGIRPPRGERWHAGSVERIEKLVRQEPVEHPPDSVPTLEDALLELSEALLFLDTVADEEALSAFAEGMRILEEQARKEAEEKHQAREEKGV